MADLRNIEITLNEILYEIKYGRGVGGGTTGPGGGRRPTPSGGSGAPSSPSSGTATNLTKGFNGLTKTAGALSGGLKGIIGGLSGFIAKLGPTGAAVSAAIDSFTALAQAAGALTNAINHATSNLYKTQADIFDVRNEQFNKITTINLNMQAEGVKYQGDLQLKMMDTQGQILMNAAKLVTDQFIKSAEISIGSLVDGINESAYKAATAKIEANSQMQKNENIANKLEGVYERYTKQRTLEIENLKRTTKADVELENINADYRVNQAALNRKLEEQLNFFGSSGNENTSFIKQLEEYRNKSLSGEYQSSILKEKEKISPNIGGEKTDFGFWEKVYKNLAGTKESTTQLINEANRMQWQPSIHEAQSVAAITKAETALENVIGSSGQQIQDKYAEVSTEAANLVVDAVKGIDIEWLKLAEFTEKWLDKFDKITNNLGKNLGYTNRKQLDSFQQNMFVAAKVAAKFGKTFEDAAKMQQSYIENTGRNKMFSKSDYGQLMGLGEYLGDDGLAANYASEMEIFNTGVSDSVDMLDDALQDVNKIGLNGRKYTKTLVDNLKLAQKYQFKDGTKGLMRMAKWAENTRFNLAALAGMLDKVREGGLEGVITQGAQFQVLGGHAAMNADPLAMMYEAYADPEAYGRRMQDMTKGYGRVDKKTGETKFSHTEAMMLQQIAKVQGRSLEDVQNEVRARNKREVVARQLSGNFDADQQSFISNNATYNKQTGQFQVKVKNANGEYVDKDVSQLTEKDLDKLMPEQHNERMEDYMATIVDYLGQLTGRKENANARIGEATWDTRKENYRERMQIFDTNFEEDFPVFVENTKKMMNEITNSYQGYRDLFKKTDEILPQNIDGIMKIAKQLEGVLGDTASIISQANSKIETALMLDLIENPEYKDYGAGGKHPFRKNNDLTSSANDKKNISDAYDKVNKIYESSKNAGYFENFAKGQQMATARAKQFTETAKERAKENDTFGEWYNYGNAAMEQTVGRVSQFIGNLFNASAADVDDFLRVKDGIVSGKNAPIISNATNVTKINDGLVKADPKDVGIFAKEGGVIGNFLSDLSSNVNSLIGGGSVQSDNMKLEISGNLNLSSGGQSINIISELQNNPVMLRALTNILAEQISSKKNGGKHTV